MNFREDNHIISIRVLGKNYNIKCPPEQAEALQEAALRIDEKLRDMKATSGSSNTDRMLVVTALNLCHELLAKENETSDYITKIEDKLQSLQNRIQSFISNKEEVMA